MQTMRPRGARLTPGKVYDMIFRPLAKTFIERLDHKSTIRDRGWVLIVSNAKNVVYKHKNLSEQRQQTAQAQVKPVAVRLELL